MQWTTLGVEHAGAIQRFNYVSASCPRVRLSSKHEGCEQSEPTRRLVHAIGVGDLSRDETERRLDLPNSADAGDEAEPLEIGERGHHRLLAAHAEMREPLEAREDAAVLLGEVEQRAEHALGRARDDAAMLAAVLGHPGAAGERAEATHEPD